jgi:hypothetical protein
MLNIGEARKAALELEKINKDISASARWWQKIFWFFSQNGLAWRVAEKCRNIIKEIESDNITKARDLVFSIRNDYDFRASVFCGPGARTVYPRQINLLDEMLFKL